MYSTYFGFREKPFNVTPNPRFFYPNPVYQEAYANLLYGIRERKGFLVLTGEVGTGKTTVLRRLMDNMDSTLRFVFFYNTTLGFEELLSFICDELRLQPHGDGRLKKIQALNQFLLEQLRKGSTAVLFIDEAQNLSEQVFENLRLLSNLETAKEKLLQIVLAGQPELENKLDQPELRQLKQRVSLQCRLDRLKEQEVGPFINYRLKTVGYQRNDLFVGSAVKQIAFYSQGIPRLINVICDNALLIAYAASQKRVSSEIIREVARDLRLEPERHDAKLEIPKEPKDEGPDGNTGTPKVIRSREEALRLLRSTDLKGSKSRAAKVETTTPNAPSRDEAVRAFTDETLQAMEDLGSRPLARYAVMTLLALLFLGAAVSVTLKNKERLQRLGFGVENLLSIAGEGLGVFSHNINERPPDQFSVEAEAVNAREYSATEAPASIESHSHTQKSLDPDGKPQALADQSKVTSPLDLYEQQRPEKRAGPPIFDGRNQN